MSIEDSEKQDSLETSEASNKVSIAMNLTVAGLKELLDIRPGVVLDKVERRAGSLKLKLYLVESLVSTYTALVVAESSVAAITMVYETNQETYRATFISYPMEGTTKGIMWSRS